MAHRVNYKIRVSPVEEIEDADGNTYEVLSGEIRQKLGGHGSATGLLSYGAPAILQGAIDGEWYYLEALDSADTTTLSNEQTAALLAIQNTGYEFSSTSILGDTLNKALKVMVNTTLVSILDSNEIVVFKDTNAGIDCRNFTVRTVDLDGSNNTSAGHLAVRFFIAHATDSTLGILGGVGV